MAGRTPQGSAFARLVMGVVIFLSLVVSGCSAKAQTLAAATPTPEPAFVATLRPKLAATMQQLGIPGAISMCRIRTRGRGRQRWEPATYPPMRP